jgi:hypothetical protein
MAGAHPGGEASQSDRGGIPAMRAASTGAMPNSLILLSLSGHVRCKGLPRRLHRFRFYPYGMLAPAILGAAAAHFPHERVASALGLPPRRLRRETRRRREHD